MPARGAAWVARGVLLLACSPTMAMTLPSAHPSTMRSAKQPLQSILVAMPARCASVTMATNLQDDGGPETPLKELVMTGAIVMVAFLILQIMPCCYFVGERYCMGSCMQALEMQKQHTEPREPMSSEV